MFDRWSIRLWTYIVHRDYLFIRKEESDLKFEQFINMQFKIDPKLHNYFLKGGEHEKIIKGLNLSV